MAELRVESLVKHYGGFEALKTINLDIRDGEFVVFVGPSGSGKSTLLRCIGGLETITSGAVVVDGRDITGLDPSERELAMVFQNYALFPQMTCRQNLEFPLRMARESAAAMREQVDRVGSLLRISDLLDRKPSELSGGQRQRVAIGRAIVKEPKVFLFDEPLSNLDAELRIKMRVEIIKLHRELANTIIYVTHDQTEAMTMADRIVVLRGGTIEQIGTPHELYYRPVNQFVAGFIGSPQMNFFACTLLSPGVESTQVCLPNGEVCRLPVNSAAYPEGAQMALGLRPEHALASPPEEAALRFDVAVELVEHLGASTYVHGKVVEGKEEQDIVISVREDIGARFGQKVVVWASASACHLFDDTGKALLRLADDRPWHRE